MSGAEWPSNYKVANSGRKEHIPGEIEEKLVRLYRPVVRNGTLMATPNSIQQQQPALTVVSSVAAAYHCAMGDDFGESHLSRVPCGGT